MFLLIDEHGTDCDAGNSQINNNRPSVETAVWWGSPGSRESLQFLQATDESLHCKKRRFM